MTMLNSHIPMGHDSPDALMREEEFLDTPTDSRTNIGSTERTISMAAGALLAIVGLSRRSIGGLVVAGVGGGLIRRGVTGNCPAYRALGLNTADGSAAALPGDYFERGIHIEEAITISKPPWALYQYWRNFENLPRIMSHLESVRVIDDQRSHWVAKAPSSAGGKVEWDAEIINDEPSALIAWRSLKNADVDNAGSVRFVPAPTDGATEVKIVIHYIPPVGRLGSWIAEFFGEEPQQQIQEDLRQFKRIMETGHEA